MKKYPRDVQWRTGETEYFMRLDFEFVDAAFPSFTDASNRLRQRRELCAHFDARKIGVSKHASFFDEFANFAGTAKRAHMLHIVAKHNPQSSPSEPLSTHYVTISTSSKAKPAKVDCKCFTHSHLLSLLHSCTWVPNVIREAIPSCAWPVHELPISPFQFRSDPAQQFVH